MIKKVIFRLFFSAIVLAAAYSAGPVYWIGNASHFPAGGEIDPVDNVWINIECWPAGGAVSARVVYNAGSGWQSASMSFEGLTGNNDHWNVNLGSFPADTSIRYAIEVVDGNSTSHWDNNNANDYYAVVNGGGHQTDSIEWRGDKAAMYIEEYIENAGSGLRRYNLSTTASLRDDFPSSKQVMIEEQQGQIVSRTGDIMFDGLFALAMQEVRENSVSQVRDGAYNNGNSIECPEGGCFETGKKWTYVWTRDTAYSVDLSLALIDPVRAKNSLEFKISERRGGGNPEIVQDTGSGGSWPVSTDRVVWALGAVELLKYLDGDERTAFRDRAYQAMVNTVENDRIAVYDNNDGLYRGEQSFLDWREQTYAAWTKEDTVHIGMSKALSTNINHYTILKTTALVAYEKGETAAGDKYSAWAADLKEKINTHLWLPEKGLYSTLKTTALEQAVVEKYDLLGECLAVIEGVADQEKARQILAAYPHSTAGPPVIWPQQPRVPIYHNRGIWPFVTAYSLKAARIAKNERVVNHNVRSMMTGAAINLSNMENFEFLTLGNYVADGDYSGPVINSQRQLWSVAGYASMVLDTLFGREATQEGIRFLPFITAELRNGLFAATNTLELQNISYKGKTISVKILLPPADGSTSGYYDIADVKLNGVSVSPESYFSKADLLSDNTITISITANQVQPSSMTIVEDKGDFKDFFAPLEPEVTGITLDNGLLKISFDGRGETGITFNIYRNGVLAASGLGENSSSWTDPGSADYDKQTYVYTVSSFYISSGNMSNHSKPLAYWTENSIQEINVPDSNLVSNDNASTEFNHGREHFNNWGYQNQTLEASQISPAKSGFYKVQINYANSMGAINTGITASVKKVEIYEHGLVSSSIVFMPHLKSWDTWGESSLTEAVYLEEGKRYKIVISDFYNMSYFESNSTYSGQGGTSGINNRANVQGVKLLFIQ